MSALANLQRTYDNYTRLLLATTELIAAPPGQLTQAKVDAVVAIAEGAGILTPSVNASVDGESYDWVGYATFITTQLETLEKCIQRAGGCFEMRSRCRT